MNNTDNETESGAMTEGYAAYVGALAWYQPNDAASTATASYGGVLLEPIVTPTTEAQCIAHGLRPRNVAKAFWDWDDISNEPGTFFPDASDDDVCNFSTTGILQTLDIFADGTSDRQDFELGNNGVNAWDYWNYAQILSSCDPEITFVNHNCLQGSEFN